VTDPVALYVHWPYCARICPYCDFNVVRARGRTEEQAALAGAMVRDLKAQAAAIGPRRLVSIFFGGGTPSLMEPADLARIVDTATGLFAPTGDLEITLEANPTDAEADRYAGFAAAGVNRLSLGVQSLDDAALKFLGRNHDGAEALRAAEVARRAFPRLSIDLIYARPEQTAAAWKAELEAALAALDPEHVSPYQLTIEAGTAFDRAVARGRFRPPEGEPAAALYDVTQGVLQAHGFDAYEVSNHARGEAARSRHNLAIWRGAEYLGVGPGAHGRAVLDGVRTATRARARIADYVAAVDQTGVGFETEPLTGREVAEERVMLGLRVRDGVGADTLDALGLSTETTPAADLIEAGLLRAEAGRISATDEGRLVLDRVISDLLTA
jgi:oxygen-independent coproporphyrinogen-3 oxidase